MGRTGLPCSGWGSTEGPGTSPGAGDSTTPLARAEQSFTLTNASTTAVWALAPATAKWVGNLRANLKFLLTAKAKTQFHV